MALLAIVDAAGDRGLSRDKLLGLLWSDSESERARGALAQALYSLRKSLGSEDLFVGANEIRLNRAVLDSDRSRFLAAIAKGDLATAVTCYAGPYLDGFYLSDAPEFEVWLDGERNLLAHRYVESLQKLAAGAESSGDALAAVGWWRKLVIVDPLNGQLALGLMRALAAAGDRAGALQHARIYEKLVRQELDVDGDAEVRAFAEELKRPPTPVPPAAPPAQRPVASAPGAAAPRVRHSLAEQLSTAEVVAVAMDRLKKSRTAHEASSGPEHQGAEDGTKTPTTDKSADATTPLASMQARFPKDRYVIVREAGAGGMATVYQARDIRHDRDVAIKVLHEPLGAALGAERFLAEIKTTARLQHPHILPLLDSGKIGEGANELLFYVMPFVAGETLRERLNREKQLPLVDAVRIATEVADALEYAHSQRIVHRDIKPENILLQGAHALVADFGIALAFESAGARVTQLGLSLGTPEYMAPEQAMGRREVDHRADLYALGAVTYEMLTGEPPFTGATSQSVVAKILTERPISPRVVRATIPLNIERAILTALEKIPADRFASGTAFAESLRVPLPSQPVPPGATSAPPPQQSAKRRLPRAAAVGVAVVALGAVAAFVLRTRAPAPLAMGTVTQITRSKDTLNFDAAISPDGKFVAYASGAAGRMRLYVRQVSGSAPVPIATGLAGDHRWPRWSPDGSSLAFVADKAIHMIPVLGGVPKLVVRLGDFGGGEPAWSPDGTQLAYSDSAGISVSPITGGSPRRIVRSLEAHSPTWSPDAKRIAYVVENLVFVKSTGYGNAAPSSIWTASAAGGDSVLVAEATHLNMGPVWWPDGRSLLYISDRDGPRDLYRQPIDAKGRIRGQVARVTSGLEVYSFTLTRDGSAMAYSTLRLRANIWMAPVAVVGETPSSLAHPVTTERQAIEGIALSHDGKWLAYDSNRNGNLDIFKVAFNGRSAEGSPVALTSSSAPDYEPRWSPNDAEIVFYSRRYGSRDVFTVNADGGAETRVTTLPGNEYYPDWAPDGKGIVFSSQVSYGWDVFVTERQQGSIWSTPQPISSQATPTVNVRWGPDGRSLAVVSDSALRILSLDGAGMKTVVEGRVLRETITFVVWGRDPTQIFFQTRDSSNRYSFWSSPVSGGRARRLLRLAEPGPRTRRPEFDTDGKNLFFTVVEDEADVAVAKLKRP